MGRFRDKLKKFANGKVPLDKEIWAHLQFSQKISYLKGKIEGLTEDDITKVKWLWYEEIYEDTGHAKDAFEQFREELKKLGIDPEEHGMPKDRDPYEFRRGYTKWKSRQLKKK